MVTAQASRRVSLWKSRTLFEGFGGFLLFALLCFGVFIMTEPMADFINHADPAHPNKNGTANFTILAIQAPTVLALAGLLLANYRRLPPFLFRSIGFWAYMIAAWMLTNFALDPKWSFYAFVWNLFAVIAVMALCVVPTAGRAMRGMFIMFTVSFLLSILFVIFLPKYGIMSAAAAGGTDTVGRAWRGIYYQKNFLGHLAAIAFVCLLFYGRPYLRSRLFWGVSCLSAFVCLVFAKSAGGLMIAAILFMLYFLVFRQRGLARIAGILAVVFASAIGALFKSVLASYALRAVGKDETLTGRAAIWSYAGQYVHDRPFVGLGYNFTASPAMTNDLLSHLNILSVHNAYLDTLINMGWLGIVLLGLAILSALIGAWRLPLTGDDEVLRNVCTLITIGSLISGLSEALIVQPLGPEPVTFLFGLFGLYRVGIYKAPTRVRSPRSRAAMDPENRPKPRRRVAPTTAEA